MEKVEDGLGGVAVVDESVSKFKDEYYLTLAGKISRKERKDRIAKYGHLNLDGRDLKSEEEEEPDM